MPDFIGHLWDFCFTCVSGNAGVSDVLADDDAVNDGYLVDGFLSSLLVTTAVQNFLLPLRL